MEDIKCCKHCGENYFEEDIDRNGICKICNEGHLRYIYNEKDSDTDK